MCVSIVFVSINKLLAPHNDCSIPLVKTSAKKEKTLLKLWLPVETTGL